MFFLKKGNIEMKWQCPFCNHIQTVTDAKSKEKYLALDVGSSKHKNLAIAAQVVGCSNPECDEVQVRVSIGRTWENSQHGDYRDHIEHFNIRPLSTAKPQPEIIPETIREDYYEACKIKDLSPQSVSDAFSQMHTRNDQGLLFS